MSVLANITVIECDRCKKVITLKNDEQRTEFEATWFSDILFDVCPDCRVMPLTKEETAKDEFVMSIF